MTITNPTAEERDGYIAGLRMLANLLDANPHLRLPHHGTYAEIAVYLTTSEDQRARLAEWAKVLPGRKTKAAAGVEGYLYKLMADLCGLKFKVICDRDEVCERIVVATREVTEEIPDPVALAVVPTTTVTTTVEDVEWVCHSILDDRPAELIAVAS